jgi:hypothetical protein
MVIVIIYYIQTQSTGIPCAFILSYQVLFQRMDVRIAVIYRGTDPVLEKTFDYGG